MSDNFGISGKARALELFHAGKLADAKVLYEELLVANQSDPELWRMLGLIGGRQEHYTYAVSCFRNLVALRPDDIEGRLKLALALRFTGNPGEAESEFRKVLELQPGNAEAGDGLGYLLFGLGRKSEAAEVFRMTLESHPGKAERHSVYGSVLQACGMFDAAVSAYKRALEINPDLFVFTAIGGCLQAQGLLDEAMKYYREGVARQAHNDSACSGLLMALNYLPDISREDMFSEHMSWGEARNSLSDPATRFENTPEPGRKLRIGYVSPDFRRNHSVTYFAEPVISSHNRAGFEIFCYSMMPRPDETTMRFRKVADHWRDIHGLNADRVAARIRQDGIDILVDLAGHTAHNNIGVFARKPAPVQVTYIGYPNTTGLQAMDYRLTDALADREDADPFYTESLVRLPGCFLCYQPPADAPPVSSLPALENGYVTFASFNNLSKVNEGMVALWRRVLEAVPGSHLILKYQALEEASTRQRYMEMFTSRGISPGRIKLLGHIESRAEHLALYGSVDIALDTFPYNGTTTTCESLWMGVPVMTLAGEVHASRVGASLLGCAGLQDWVADIADDFVDMIRGHAADTGKLSDLRGRLRSQVDGSALCQGEEFIVKLESAYREMWHCWCSKQRTHAGQ